MGLGILALMDEVMDEVYVQVYQCIIAYKDGSIRVAGSGPSAEKPWRGEPSNESSASAALDPIEDARQHVSPSFVCTCSICRMLSPCVRVPGTRACTNASAPVRACMRRRARTRTWLQQCASAHVSPDRRACLLSMLTVTPLAPPSLKWGKKNKKTQMERAADHLKVGLASL